MKINKLRLKNLNSLKGEHEIDFADGPLAENGIFAITGPTGAGKTTLLDAICLALYNRVPRTKKVSATNLTQSGAIRTRNTSDSYAEVEYSANGKFYRSHWSIRVTRGGNLEESKMTLADVSTGEFFDLKKSEVPKQNEVLIGLGFEQFLKSSLLAQGEFAKFLKADKDERGKLLENITGTTIYREIGVAAFDKQKCEREKLEWLEKGVEKIELLSEEQEVALKEESAQKEEEKKSNKEQLDQLVRTKQLYELILKDRQSLTQKQQEAQNIEQQILAFDTEKQRLDQHKKVSVHQELIGQYENLAKETEQLQQKIDRDTEQHQTHEQSKVKLVQETEKLEKELTTKEAELISLKPVWEQVKQWDIEIAEETRTINRQSSELEELNANIEKKNLALSQLLSSKKTTLNAQSNCEAYLSETEGLKALSSDLSGLEKQYISASNLTGDCHQVRDQVIFHNQELSQAIKGLNKPDEMLRYIEELPVDHQATDSVTEAVDTYRTKIKQLEYALNTRKELNRQAQRIQADQSELDQTLVRITEEEALIQDLKQSIDQLVAQQTIKKLAVDELEIRHQRQLLEAKYEEDRGTLVENQPCPLCGSEQHPFVTEYTNTVNKTAELLKQAKLDHEAINKELIEKQAKIKSTQEKLAESKDRQASLALANQTALDELKALGLTINVEADLALLTADSFVADAEQLLQTSEQELELLIKQEKQQQDNKVLGTLQSAAQKAKQAADLYKSEVAPYSAIIGNPTIAKLKEAAQSYEDNKSRLQQVQSELQTIEKTEELTTQSLADSNTIKTEKEASLTKAKKALTLKQEERSDTFGVKNTDHEQAALVQAIDTIKTNHNNAKVENARLSESIQSLETSLASLNKDLQEKQEQFETSTSALSQVAQQLNLDSIEQLRKCLLSVDSVAEIEEKDRTLDRKKETVSAEITRLSEAIASQSTDLHEDYDYEASNASIASFESLQDALTKRISEIEFTLNSNKEKASETVKLRAEIDDQKTVFSKWKKLSELIGSADGKVFSIFAQNLTLQHLIFLANKHLSTLSDRYVLIKDANDDKKEDIYIRDQWQGDAERSVSTLSGGESFIVSLSLALGLSEMASKNVKIESLFIDEGFGTLDQNTLETVLTVLEQLQYKSSCSIGIISHVEQLKERITTQIVLEPNASGHSTITVEG